MASENPTWGAPRIHGELLKLGFEISERTVSAISRREIFHFDATEHLTSEWVVQQLREASPDHRGGIPVFESELPKDGFEAFETMCSIM